MSLVLHSFVIPQPPHYQIQDEFIFLEITRDFLKGEDHTPYQLPGEKFFVATAIYIFGDHWFSWRAPSVIFGLLTLLVFYSVCIRFTSKQNALLATTLLSFDSIFFVHSSLFLRDVPLMFFGLLSFYLYLKKKYYLAALPLGFAFLIKETAILFFILIIVYHIAITKPWKNHVNITQLKTGSIFLGIIVGVFFVPLWLYDAQINPVLYDPVIPTKEVNDKVMSIGYPKLAVLQDRGEMHQKKIGVISNPVEHLSVFFKDSQIFSEAYSVKNWNSVFPSSFAWNWILPHELDNYNRVAIIPSVEIDNIQEGMRNKGMVLGIEWQTHANQSLWIIGFWASLSYIGYGIIKSRINTILFLSVGVSVMYVPYLIVSLLGRIAFPYYFILTIPFISLGVVLLLDLIKNEKVRTMTKASLLGLVVAWFVWLYPLKIFS